MLRLAVLKERERQVREAIAREQMRLARRKSKQDARLFALVGRALVQRAAQHPEFELMLKQTLATAAAVLSDSEKNVLRACGWLLPG